MEFCDSHIHLQDYKTEDINNVIKNAALCGVTKFINVSAHPSDWGKVDEIAEKYPQIIPAYGVHPWYLNEAPKNWAEQLEQRLRQNPVAVVGECGIDRLKNSDVKVQRVVFLQQAELAQSYGRSLIIHAVKADEEMQKLFGEMPERTVFHSFTGSAEWGKNIQRHGFYIGINFSILRKKNMIEILQNLDINHILLETDGPYQNNVNGESLPENLPRLAEQIAQIFGLTVLQLSRILTQNWHNFLGE